MGKNIDYSYLDKPIEDAIERKLSERGGSGYNGGMNGWAASVEARLGKIESALTDIKVEMAKLAGKIDGLSGKIDGLPSKAFVIGTVISLLGFGLTCFAAGHNLLK